MTWTCQIAGPGLRLHGNTDGQRSIRGGNASTDTFCRIDGFAESSAEARCVVRRHQRKLEPVANLRTKREADQAPAISGHKVNDLGSDLLGGYSKIAFILAILVVDDDKHTS